MKLLLLILFVLAIIVLFAVITAFTWNHSIGQIFHLPSMTIWQAFCLNVLGNLVCGGIKKIKMRNS